MPAHWQADPLAAPASDSVGMIRGSDHHDDPSRATRLTVAGPEPAAWPAARRLGRRPGVGSHTAVQYCSILPVFARRDYAKKDVRRCHTKTLHFKLQLMVGAAARRGRGARRGPAVQNLTLRPRSRLCLVVKGQRVLVGLTKHHQR